MPTGVTSYPSEINLAINNSDNVAVHGLATDM